MGGKAHLWRESGEQYSLGSCVESLPLLLLPPPPPFLSFALAGDGFYGRLRHPQLSRGLIFSFLSQTFSLIHRRHTALVCRRKPA